MGSPNPFANLAGRIAQGLVTQTACFVAWRTFPRVRASQTFKLTWIVRRTKIRGYFRSSENSAATCRRHALFLFEVEFEVEIRVWVSDSAIGFLV